MRTFVPSRQGFRTTPELSIFHPRLPEAIATSITTRTDRPKTLGWGLFAWISTRENKAMIPLSRRHWLHYTLLAIGSARACGAVGGSPAGPICCHTPELECGSVTFREGVVRIDLQRAASLARPCSAAALSVRSQNLHLLVVRDRRSQFHVVSGRCTHGGQVISYLPQRGVLMCNNFNHSVFTLTGDVLKGPAESPLARYSAHRCRNGLEVDLTPTP